jgi:hypothetical protein
VMLNRREMIAYYKLFARMATSEDKISRSLTSWLCAGCYSSLYSSLLLTKRSGI